MKPSQSDAPTQSIERYIVAEDFRDQKPSLKVVRQLIRDLFEEKWLFFWGALLIVIGTAATLLEPRIFGYAIDHAILQKDLNGIQKLALFYLGVTLVRVTSVTLQSYSFEKLSQRMMDRLRSKLYLHLQALPTSTYDTTPVGRLITRLTGDTSAMSELFSNGFVTMVGNLLFVLGSIVWLLVLNWKLALLTISVFPVLIFFSIRFSHRLIRIYRESRMRLSALNAFLAENILGMKIVHLFNREATHLSHFQEVSDSYRESQAASVKVYAYFQPLITWCSGLGVALVIGVGGIMTLKGELTHGEWVAFIGYVFVLFNPIRDLVDRWTIFLSGLTAAERIYQLMDWGVEMPPQKLYRPIKKQKDFRGEITFEQVWFAYNEENWVLKDFSFQILPGQKVGVVGHTGAGKTTLISLMLRLYEPQKGRILIDGQDIREMDLRELRDQIGLIQQDVFLFSGKISDNIGLFSEQAISQQSLSVLASLGFKKPLETPLDERGANLSMGEKQWISFVRAVEKKPSIWILDEATAHVDSDSEIQLGRALESSTSGRSLLMIAHRLATIKMADRIIVLHRGSLVEQGTHSELLKSGGYYSRLYRYQSALEDFPGQLGNQSV